LLNVMQDFVSQRDEAIGKLDEQRKLFEKEVQESRLKSIEIGKKEL